MTIPTTYEPRRCRACDWYANTHTNCIPSGREYYCIDCDPSGEREERARTINPDPTLQWSRDGVFYRT
jgi:hypothetical protein